jgi:PAS domain S-box-containing protein
MSWMGGVDQLFPTKELEFTKARADWDWRIDPADRHAVSAAVSRLTSGSISQLDLGYRIEGRDGHQTQVFDRWFALPNTQGRPEILAGTLYLGASLATPETDESLLINGDPCGIEDFAAFADSLPSLAWETDADGWIYFYNRSWYEYSGIGFDQMKGWGWIAVHDPVDLPRVLKTFRAALVSGNPWQDEFRLRRADGMMRWHLSRAMPVRDADGRIIRWFGTNTDIHDQKMAAIEREALLEAEQQLRQAAETANQEKDEFLAVVSHELRNPLNAVPLMAIPLAAAAPSSPSDRETAADTA